MNIQSSKTETCIVHSAWAEVLQAAEQSKKKQLSGFSFEQDYLKCKLTHCNMHNQSCKLSLFKSLRHFGKHAWKTTFVRT